MTDILIALLGIAAGYGLAIAWGRWQKRRADKSPIYAIAEDLESFFEKSAHPSDVLTHPRFKAGVHLLGTDAYSTDDLIAYAKGSNSLIACLAAEALSHRTDGEPTAPLLEHFDTVYGTPERFFFLRLFERRGDDQIIGRVVKTLDDTWEGEDEPLLLHFIRQRIAAGDEPALIGFDSSDEDDLAWVKKFLGRVDAECKTKLLDGFDAWGDGKLDVEFLNSCGRIVTDAKTDDRVVVESVDVVARVDAAIEALESTPPRCVLLVGEPGTGKSTTLGLITARLRRDDWTIFEASGADLLAGQMYFGQLEGRMQRLLRSLKDRPKVLWVAHAIHEFLYLGKHRNSETSLLDTILPAIEAGKIRMIGEIDPAALERVAQAKPRAKTTFTIVPVPPATDRQTIDLAAAWAERVTPDGAPPLVDRPTLIEAFKLVRQFFHDRASPGVLLEFLDHARELCAEAADAPGTPPTVLTRDDLTTALHRLTGLPATIIDDRVSLSVDDLSAFFHARVKGQAEAIECLVERVAMIKAGLTDPTRPQGVFLFTGPTGTGKTEIAKTLAAYLFGSPSRMIRLDMSEFQTAESQSRILGDPEGSTSHTALVDEIRKQPFSVILLDEFEKAHERAWDLFLQVFDDGRLTDRRGNVADFRHAIIIMTANVTTQATEGGIGFGSAAPVADSTAFDDPALTQVFRKEFLNRIDRIVTFRPLTRQVMREVLEKELDLVLERRGLRNRDWAVEWDPSAQDFLLDRGFSAAFGARPLKRAIERYLLSPLAMTIVNHRVPDGEQFLFVRSDGHAIQVEFIDPDAPLDGATPAPDDAETAAVESEASAPSLGRLALDSTGTAAELDVLARALTRLQSTTENDAWTRRKRDHLAAISKADFWRSDDRFIALGEVEYMDRIEAGLKTAESLHRRLEGNRPGERERFPAQLVHRLAHQLFLVDEAIAAFEAAEADDAYLCIDGPRDPKVDPTTIDRIARRVASMYRHWATNRRMTLDVLHESHADATTPYRFVCAVSGYASWRLLRDEAGLHVFELPPVGDHARERTKVKVRVGVTKQPPIPLDPNDAPLDDAERRLAAETSDTARVVRRYREAPSPLVRDNVRGWRTGRIDRVLDGAFDLYAR